MNQGMERDDQLAPTEGLPTRRASDVAATGDSLPPSARVGPYRIVALLGRGGMGEVYEAEQLEPVRRRVALKLLRGRRMDARERAYFEVERQTLAQMQHPAIAQIHDAGTTADGHPYFAMEYIQGHPVTRFCEEKGLSLRERVALFVRICEGVQHAHQKGVIHRDLKPGNILVTEVDGRPLPKIIDFGIATATSRALRVGAADDEQPGTPEYMSPEQARRDRGAVDTRSDVYSLGVVLYELLAGRRPNPTPTSDAAAPVVSSPRPPSEQVMALIGGDADRFARAQGLRRALRRELDWVVLKAMHPERTERYASAGELAEELRRFLNDRPLAAMPARRGYVWGKFARRHRVAIGAAAAVLLALLGGLGLLLAGLQQAQIQRALAEARQAELEKVVAFQQSMLEGVDVEAMGLGLADDLRDQLKEAAAGERAALQRALQQASPADLARTLLDRHVLGGAERAIAEDFPDQPAMAADLRESVARVREAFGLYAASAAGFAEVVEYRATALGPRHPETLRARAEHAGALQLAGRFEEAQKGYEATLADARALSADDELRIKLELGRSEALAARGDLKAARSAQDALLARVSRARGEGDPSALRIMNNLGITLARLGDYAAARVLFERLVALRTRTLGPDHQDTLASTTNLASLRGMSGDLEGALELQARLVEVHGRQRGSEHPLTLAARNNYAATLVNLGRLEEARKELADVFEARKRVLGPDHAVTLRTESNLASVSTRLGDYRTAMRLDQDLLRRRERLLGPRHPDTLTARFNHAGTLFHAGQIDAAEPIANDVLQLRREVLGAKHPDTAHAAMMLGQIVLARGGIADAVPVYREAFEIRRSVLGENHPETIEAAWRLSDALADVAADAESSALRRKYVEPLLSIDEAALTPSQKRLLERMHEDG